MSAVTSFAEAVQFAARCIECPICKEACENPVRPKNCSHRYCMGCFRKCFQDKQEKHCATCRTPILSVSKRGFTEDALFAKVAALVPGIRDAESDDDFDLAKMMERHRQQSEKIRREAIQMRQGLATKPPVTHATRQHPESMGPPRSVPSAQHAQHARPNGSTPASPHAARGTLPPLDAAVRSPLPPFAAAPPPATSAGAPAHAGHGLGLRAAAVPVHARNSAAAGSSSTGDALKRGAGSMAVPTAQEPDAKRAKGSD